MSALGAAAGLVLPSGLVHAAPAPATRKSANGKIGMGFIGLGQQARQSKSRRSRRPLFRR